MCIGGAPSAPSPPPLPPEPPPPPTEADPAVARAQKSERQRAALAQGRSDTLLTGAAGLTQPANTTKKTLLGG